MWKSSIYHAERWYFWRKFRVEYHKENIKISIFGKYVSGIELAQKITQWWVRRCTYRVRSGISTESHRRWCSGDQGGSSFVDTSHIRDPRVRQHTYLSPGTHKCITGANLSGRDEEGKKICNIRTLRLTPWGRSHDVYTSSAIPTT